MLAGAAALYYMYKNRTDAMRALERRFNVPPDEVSETRWQGNLSPYMDES